MSSTPPPSRAIVADGLVMHFGDVHALQGVSFDVPTGSVLGLLGPNGAGKTTAVRILTTILKPLGDNGGPTQTHALLYGSPALDLADNWLNLWRLELTVWADNTAAQQLYRRQGFVVEGTHRAYALRHGQLVDALAMARLHPNPPAFK